MPIHLKIFGTIIIVILFYKGIYSLIYRPVVDFYNVTLDYRRQYQSFERDIKLSINTETIDAYYKEMNKIKDKHNVLLELYPNNFINVFLKVKPL